MFVFCYVCMYCLEYVFFFKQKTAYEMRISDWSSDVCSSDLSHPQDAGHGQPGVVVENRARNAAEEGEGRHMAIAEGLADLRRIGFDKAGIRVRQVHGKEVRLAHDPGDHHQGLAEIHKIGRAHG